MPSVAHVYGKPIVGSEAFTSDRDEKWMGYPANYQGGWAIWAYLQWGSTGCGISPVRDATLALIVKPGHEHGTLRPPL